MPEEYRETAEASGQADALFELELLQAIDISKRLIERDFYFQWVSVYMPQIVLADWRLERKLMKIFEEVDYPTGKMRMNCLLRIQSVDRKTGCVPNLKEKKG